jgi:hypothetical protein
MNEEWLVYYLFLALDCSLPIVDALSHASLLIGRYNQNIAEVVVHRFLANVEAKYGTLTVWSAQDLRAPAKYAYSDHYQWSIQVTNSSRFIDREIELTVLWSKSSRQIHLYRSVKDGRFSNKQEIVLSFLLWKKQLDDQLAICPQIPQRLSELIKHKTSHLMPIFSSSVW